MKEVLRILNVVLRALMELGFVVALGFWGYHAGASHSWKIIASIAVPAAGFAFWGLIDFRKAGRLAEPLRLAQELALTALGVAAWGAAGHWIWASLLAVISVLHHVLVYALDDRLLKDRG